MRFLVLAASGQSATTLLDYCTAFDILADVFETAEAAVKSLQRSVVRYDLLVVEPDGMGGMGGFAFCSWFRQAQPTLPGWQAAQRSKALPTEILVLSSRPDTEACAAVGSATCRCKPLSPPCVAVAGSRRGSSSART
jgi:CheY-like chemotaxis protein